MIVQNLSLNKLNVNIERKFMKKLFFLLVLSVMACNVFCWFPPTNEKDRQPSYPFISGDTFRSIADHKLDSASKIQPEKVKNGDLIFIARNYIDNFFKQIEPKISYKFILITHNGDDSLPGDYSYYLDSEKLIAWFTVNSDTYHPKLHTIPIGIANRYWSDKGHCHGNVNTFFSLRKENAFFNNKREDKLLYVNFAMTNREVRQPALDYLKKQKFVFLASPKPHREYLKEMSQFQFVACPLGNGFDCHRTWEALYVGCIPVIQKSSINAIFEGLPVIIINDWKEVTQEFLKQEYKSMSTRIFHEERKYVAYWIDKIEQIKNEV